MVDTTNAPEQTKISVSIPLEAATGPSHSIRSLRANQGLKEREISFRIPTNQDAAIHVHDKHGQHSWQAKILKVLHTKWFQRVMLGLLLTDVLILFTELFLLATYPQCSIIVRDAISCCPPEEAARWLASDSHSDICEAPTEVTDYHAGCDDHKWHTVHTIEHVLFGMTIGILSCMMLELLLLMAAISPCVFFRHFWYILDFIIVAVSLSLEAVFKSVSQEQLATYVGLLIIFRCWRFVRISHCLVEVTAELTAQRYEGVVEKAIELEDLMAKHEAKMAALGIDVEDSASVIEIREMTKSLADHLLATQDEDADLIHFSKFGKSLAEKAQHHKSHHKDNDSGEEPATNSESHVEKDVDNGEP